MGDNNGCGWLPSFGMPFFPSKPPSDASDYWPRQMVAPVEPSIAEEVAELRKQVEELVYWMRPMTGNLITGKAAVEEYKRLAEAVRG